MKRERLAIQIVIVGLVLGFLGGNLFYPYLVPEIQPNPIPRLGIGFPIFVVAVVLMGLLLARLHRVPLGWRRIWLVIPLLFFAVMVTVRADWILMLLNIIAVFALSGLLLHYLPQKRYLDQATTLEYSLALVAAGVTSALMPLSELAWVRRWFTSLKLQEAKGLVQVGRGVLLAMPVLIVFMILLGSADAIFAERVRDLLLNLMPHDAQSLFVQGVLIIVIAYVVIGFLAYGLTRAVDIVNSETAESESDTESPASQKRSGQLGIIEAGIVLGSINLLFLFFVLIQIQYLFGSTETISTGLTYATYARRGFFELVAVTVLVLALGLWLDRATLRRRALDNGLFRALAIVMVTLTLVMLVSAWHRMSLYEMAYGFTHLRVYTHIFMLALAALLGAFLLELFRVKSAIFSFSLLVVMIAYLGILNVLNVENYIAWHNIERDTSEVPLDICYLRTLSVDALSAIHHIYESSESDLERQHALWWLSEQWRELETMPDKPISMLNLSQQSAYMQLDAIHDVLVSDNENDPTLIYCSV